MANNVEGFDKILLIPWIFKNDDVIVLVAVNS